ncbi:MAG: hypothetical protein ACE15D_15375 [Candidatus Eisenbacteria bacterium]
MSRKTAAVAAILTILGCICIAPAWAGVPKVIVCEEFGATW